MTVARDPSTVVAERTHRQRAVGASEAGVALARRRAGAHAVAAAVTDSGTRRCDGAVRAAPASAALAAGRCDAHSLPDSAAAVAHGAVRRRAEAAGPAGMTLAHIQASARAVAGAQRKCLAGKIAAVRALEPHRTLTHTVGDAHAPVAATPADAVADRRRAAVDAAVAAQTLARVGGNALTVRRRRAVADALARRSDGALGR